MSLARRWAFACIGLVAFAVAGCGGGGSSSSGTGATAVVPLASPSATAAPSPSPTPTAPASIAGTVTELVSGAPLAGFTVTVGYTPAISTCLGAQTATSMPCGVPAPPLSTATTNSAGTFSVAAPGVGTYMLTIGKDATYATLHRSVTVAASGTSLGTLRVAALSSDEQAWLVDVNHQRLTVSSPASFPNLIVDEYAEEQARQWAADMVAGKIQYDDAAASPYQAAYVANPGAMYLAAMTLALIGPPSSYVQADAGWMGEKTNCTAGNWQTCQFAENTGHYINISNTEAVWIGLGETASNGVGSPSAYDLMLIQIINAGPGPASARRSK